MSVDQSIQFYKELALKTRKGKAIIAGRNLEIHF